MSTPHMTGAEIGHLDRAAHWLAVHRPERALDELDQLGGALAVSDRAQTMRAHAYLDTDQPSRAAAAVRQAIADHGPSPTLCFFHALALQQLEDVSGAERAVLQGLALDPEDVDLLCLYAEICVRAGQVAKAEALVDRAAASAPDARYVLHLRVLIAHTKGDSAGARRLLARYLAQDPENPAARLLQAVVAADRGDVTQAYSSARHVVAADPGDAGWVDAATELRVASHPALWPLRPIMRWGPGVMWLVQVAVIGLAIASGVPVLQRVVPFVVLGWVAYSWVAPPLVRRWVRWRMR